MQNHYQYLSVGFRKIPIFPFLQQIRRENSCPFIRKVTPPYLKLKLFPYRFRRQFLHTMLYYVNYIFSWFYGFQLWCIQRREKKRLLKTLSKWDIRVENFDTIITGRFSTYPGHLSELTVILCSYLRYR